MNSCLLTVGMPVYNGADYINEALECLVSQSLKNFRILISDNASTDATPAILAMWQARDSRIQVVRQCSNLGLTRNFRFVLEQAQTPWFAFAAHDDLWSASYFETLLEVASRRPRCRLAVPRVVMRNLRRRTERTFPVPTHVFCRNGAPRIRGLLHSAVGCWLYGLFSRQHLVSAMRQLHDYPYAWGIDPLTLLPFLLSGEVWGNDDAVFYAIDRGTPDAYKPRTRSAQWPLYQSYIKHAWDSWRNAELTQWQKLSLLPTFLWFLHRHGCKCRRLIHSAVAAALSGTARSGVSDARA
jgi:glycosyltransferase involved in cell wall biosynthesis